MAFGTVLLSVVLDRRRPRIRSGVSGPGDPRVVALVLALATAGAVCAGPVQNAVSRRVETRADLHALRLTDADAAFVRMQRSLAVANLSDLTPSLFEYVMFASHPTAAQRIALVREMS
jgi:STE24 endopeptidase